MTQHNHPQPITVFYSYAEEDATWREKLEKHLSQLKRDHTIQEFHEQMILGGSDRTQTLNKAITTAHLILLLISSDFLASDICYHEQMQQALARHQRGETHIVPILVRSCDWRHSPIGNLQCLPHNHQPLNTAKDPDAAMLDIVKEIRFLINTLNNQPSPPSPIPPAPSVPQPSVLDHLPYERNPFFTGRDDILTRLHASLQSQSTTALTQAISGLGGIGKTQTAVEYTYRHYQDYDHIFWMRAESQNTLTLDFLATAQRLGLPEQKDPALTIAAVKDWFSRHPRWLLILDNADDLSFLKPFLPLRAPGHIILTTRAQSTRGLGITNTIELNTMSEQEAVLFLLRRAGLLSPTAPLTDANPADQRDATVLVKTLGNLPLALDQAGAYLDETRESIPNYLALYQQHRATLLHRRGGIDADHASVATTWTLAFERLTQTNPAALDLIRLCAFLAPDTIPEEVFTEKKLNLTPALHEFIINRLALNDALALLSNYGLITRDPTTQTLSIHRLIQAVIQDEMDDTQQIQWATRAIQTIYTLFPFNEPGPWPLSQRAFPHALTCLDHRRRWDLTFFEARKLITKVGIYLRNRGQYAEAEPFYLQDLALDKKIMGDDHSDTANSLDNLANLYYDRGKYGEAEQLHQEALVIKRKVLGDKHPSTANSLSNLANLYDGQGKYELAEQLYQEALAIQRKVLGDKHPSIAAILNNLADLYRKQGKGEEAERLFQEALTIYQKVLGDEHPSTASTLNNLALLYRSQDKDEEAEQLYQEALAIKRKVLGDEHPSTASTLNNLALLYRSQDKYEEAEQLYQEALAIKRKVLGDEHPYTASSLNNLAYLYQIQGKYEEAEPLYQEALAIYKKVLGDEHPYTIQTMKGYATLQQEMQKREQNAKDE